MYYRHTKNGGKYKLEQHKNIPNGYDSQIFLKDMKTNNIIKISYREFENQYRRLYL